MRGKNTSVKWKMVGMILLYWAIPFVLLLALNFRANRSRGSIRKARGGG